MLKIIYTSRLRNPMGSDELMALTEAANIKNKKLGITGLLLASPHGFVQYLEGAPKPLVKLMNSIARDPRHYDVVILERKNTSQRLFPQWSMNLVAVDVRELAQMHNSIKANSQPMVALASSVMRWAEADSRSVDLQLLLQDVAKACTTPTPASTNKHLF